MMIRILLALLLPICSLTTTVNATQKSESPTEGYWDDYYQNTLNEQKPRYTLMLAQQYFDLENRSPTLAVDLGAGTGRDTLFLLRKGWQVEAIDAEPLSIEIISNRTESEYHPQLKTQINPFATMELPDNIDLINASFSLPFCPPDGFSDCWQNIVDHLAVGGRFAGQLFGDRDAWASTSPGTFHTHEQMLQLFKENFVIEYLQIEEGLLPTAVGPMKQWHVYHIVARKI
jgi:tellurite methyltransferase